MVTKNMLVEMEIKVVVILLSLLEGGLLIKKTLN